MDWVGRRSTENRVLSPSMRHQRMYSDILGWRENKTGRRGGREMRGCGGGNRIKCLSASINNYKQTKSSHVVPGFLVMCTVRMLYLISIATLAHAMPIAIHPPDHLPPFTSHCRHHNTSADAQGCRSKSPSTTRHPVAPCSYQ
jgi:hypothetical protein